MSYCVNCGVELDKTCQVCPLCQTPVLNPRQPVDTVSPPPYPSKKGVTEIGSNREFTILITIILVTTAVVCTLLNHFMFTWSHWSIYVAGLCALLWIILLPMFFPGKIHACVCLALNGVGLAAYLGIISILHPGNGWYVDIALPMAALGTVSIIIFYYFTLKRRSSFITKTVLFLGNLGVLCAVIELLIHDHYGHPIALSWSAIVLVCCASIDFILIILSFMKGPREEIRRRMHF